MQAQGGILTPTEVPLIIVVTGEEGGQYGYDDEWDADGVFHYYGAGQVGHMVFQRGNLALRDHAHNGEDVHLFEQEPSALRYVGQMVGAGYDEVEDVPDRMVICGEQSSSYSSRSRTRAEQQHRQRQPLNQRPIPAGRCPSRTFGTGRRNQSGNSRRPAKASERPGNEAST